MRTLVALAIAFTTLAAAAQTAKQNQPTHIQTAINHFTVIDPGEPIVMFALADHANFDIDQRENKLFLQPLGQNVSTNLLIWTASRELTYEIDAPGDVSKMNMLIESPPSPIRKPTPGANADEQELQRASSNASIEAVLRSEAITDDQKNRSASVVIHIDEVLHSRDQMIVRYSIRNLSRSPFRISAPDIFEARPTQNPISLLSLRDHQLSDEMFSQFKALRGERLLPLHTEVLTPDLDPGQSTVGIISIRGGQQAAPQLYELDFGSTGTQSITAAVVM
ncbi:hypothetical protein [Edaphobacter dinghuensis]|uniref:DUF4138 domain-containing protein n=1 Tax=Edaphobacter dinghuensis TaxID=1560005 RepID=A0A917HRY7_9BACT|nr:hypothetical protein [Edaphobacter dinghuensis]GGG87182.1 hypothetical protein GCM10011585_34020 [Edaphobacter dinghuensis]